MGKVFKRKIRSCDAHGELVAADIKSILKADIPGITEIAKHSFDKVWKAEEFNFFLSHPCGFCWGVFYEGELVGFFLGLLTHGELDIASVAVCTQWRRRGVAETLIACCWSMPVVERAFLEVEADNSAAISLYEKCGFHRYGLRRKYYDGKKDAVLMKKAKN